MTSKIEVVDGTHPDAGRAPERHDIRIGKVTTAGQERPTEVFLEVRNPRSSTLVRFSTEEVVDQVIAELEANRDAVFRTAELAEFEARDAAIAAMTPEERDAVLVSAGADPAMLDRDHVLARVIIDLRHCVMARDAEIEHLRVRLDTARIAGYALSCYVAGARAILVDRPDDLHARAVVQTFGEMADSHDAAMSIDKAELESGAARMTSALEGLVPFAAHAEACRVNPCDCGHREAVHAAEEALS